MMKKSNLFIVLFLINGSVYVSAQDIHRKLLDQNELNESDLRSLALFDPIPFLLKDHAYVDTTAVLSTELLYAVVVLSNETQTASEFYLMTFDRIGGRGIDLQFLKTYSDIDQIPGKEFKQSEYILKPNGLIQLSDYDCSLIEQKHRGLLAECIEVDQRHYFIDRYGIVHQR